MKEPVPEASRSRCCLGGAGGQGAHSPYSTGRLNHFQYLLRSLFFKIKKIIIGTEQGHTHMAQNSKRKKGLVVKHLSAIQFPLPVSNVPFKFILNLYKKIRIFSLPFHYKL